MDIGIFQQDISRHLLLEEKLQKVENILIENHDLNLLLLPELFLSSYATEDYIKKITFNEICLFQKEILKLSNQYSCAIAYGYPELEKDLRFNSLSIVKLGKQVFNHRKTVLPPSVMEKNLFSLGTNLSLFELDGVKCSALICYEFEFPELVRKLAKAGVQLILIPTALSEEFKFVSQEMLKTRAFENQVVLAYANYSGSLDHQNFCGQSAIVNEKGEDLIRADNTEKLIKYNVKFEDQSQRRERLPYFKDYINLEVEDC